jgi:hypothetical protein
MWTSRSVRTNAAAFAGIGVIALIGMSCSSKTPPISNQSGFHQNESLRTQPSRNASPALVIDEVTDIRARQGTVVAGPTAETIVVSGSGFGTLPMALPTSLPKDTPYIEVRDVSRKWSAGGKGGVESPAVACWNNTVNGHTCANQIILNTLKEGHLTRYPFFAGDNITITVCSPSDTSVCDHYSTTIRVVERVETPNSIEVLSTRSDEGILHTIRLSFTPRAVGLDAVGNIYVAGSNSISAFAAGAHDAARPLAIVSGSKTHLSDPNAVWVDSNRRLYVAQPNAIAVFGPDAAGNHAPERYLEGDRAKVSSYPLGIVVDSQGFIYLADSDGIEVYSPTSNGDASPIGIIRRDGFKVVAETIDSHDNLYVIGEPLDARYENSPDQISIYDLRDVGAWKLKKELSLGPFGSFASWLAVDRAGLVYLSDSFLPWPINVLSPPTIGAIKFLRQVKTFSSLRGLLSSTSAMDRNGNIYICMFDADHYRFGPLRLLMTTDEVVRELGPGTPAKDCRPNGDCTYELKYTDGNETLVLGGVRPGHASALNFLSIDRGVHGTGLAHLRSGIGPIAGWRWEGIPIFSVPPSQVKGWGVCDYGWHDRGYCGAPGPDVHSLMVNYRIRNGRVTGINFGTE